MVQQALKSEENLGVSTTTNQADRAGNERQHWCAHRETARGYCARLRAGRCRALRGRFSADHQCGATAGPPRAAHGRDQHGQECARALPVAGADAYLAHRLHLLRVQPQPRAGGGAGEHAHGSLQRHRQAGESLFCRGRVTHLHISKRFANRFFLLISCIRSTIVAGRRYGFAITLYQFATASQSHYNRLVVMLQSLHICVAIALRRAIALWSFCNITIAPHSRCNRFATALHLRCSRFVITLYPHTFALQSLFDHFAFASHLRSSRFATALQSLCNRFPIAF
jgi:hypothetical protein